MNILQEISVRCGHTSQMTGPMTGATIDASIDATMAAMEGSQRSPWPRLLSAAMLVLVATPLTAKAETTIGCVTTSWKLLGANHKVCVQAFGDPKVPGVTCHVSQARTGGISGALGLAEDPSQFSLACRQTGPITLPEKLPKDEVVFSEDTSLVFKETRVVRMWDEKNRTLVYVGISRKLIDGAPANSISTVPVMGWR